MNYGLPNTYIRTTMLRVAGKRNRLLGFCATIFFFCGILLTNGATNANAQVTITPSIAKFGSVPVGTTNTQAFQLKNTGSTSVTVFTIGLFGSGFTVVGGRSQVALAPGASMAFAVAFAPGAAQSYSGSLGITSNATNRLLTVLLSGAGTATTRSLSTSPASLSFGNVTVGGTANADVTLKSTGNASVTINSVTLSGTGFSVTGVSAGTTLAAGQSAVLVSEFSPKGGGVASGTITIASNAGTFTIPVTGDGSPTTTAHAVDLSWGASSSSGVTGYNVYRSTTYGTGYAKVASAVAHTSYADQSVQTGTKYYYVVTALSSGGESGYSNLTSATIP